MTGSHRHTEKNRLYAQPREHAQSGFELEMSHKLDGNPGTSSCTSARNLGLPSFASSARITHSTFISSRTTFKVCAAPGTPRVSARSTLTVSAGMGNPASAITSVSKWPRVAMMQDRSDSRKVVFSFLSSEKVITFLQIAHFLIYPAMHAGYAPMSL
jgi:hypothetical protein